MLKPGAICLALLRAGCSLTRSEEDPVQVELNDIESRLTRLERVLSNQSLLEMAQHLDAVQTDVRTRRGQVDELQNGADTLRKQQRDLYADLDRRMAEHGPAGAAPSGPASTPSGAASSPDQAAYIQPFEALKSGNYAASIAGFK